MKVSEWMMHLEGARQKSHDGRDRTTYRAARRNIAKINYRRAKRKAKPS